MYDVFSDVFSIAQVENKRNDDFLHQHFHSSGHFGLSHLSIQLIDRAMGERELREKELGTVDV